MYIQYKLHINIQYIRMYYMYSLGAGVGGSGVCMYSLGAGVDGITLLSLLPWR